MKNTFKKGDRVRWTGAFDRTKAHAAAVGQEGTVARDTVGDTTQVFWDCGDTKRHTLGLLLGIYNDNLELIAPVIDVTKPLELPGSDEHVTFVTETSDGNILVDVSGYGWAIFNKTGGFVRAARSYGYSLGLVNKVTKTCKYVAINNDNLATGYHNRRAAWDLNPGANYIVQVDKEDGIVVGVGVLKRPE